MSLPSRGSSEQPLLVMFIGVPGSGKTYFATRLAKRLAGVRLGGDAMRLAIFGSLEEIEATYHSKHRQRVNTYTFGAIDYVTEQLLAAGVSVVYDAIHSKREDRLKQERVANTYHALPVLVRINTPYDVALQRGTEREVSADSRKFDRDKMAQVIDQFEKSLEPPAAIELVVDIDGEATFDEQYGSFLQQVEVFRGKGNH
ncbi:MAG: ATP-binding protein [Candidatus Saccharibacteria bacterium]|nr:ATP-binding protein [Candidatus Saccharibacteria bacterium]MCA9337004.1 ATP-binding protein [Candidatus Saccharibacteria bacterium]MCA9340225.1 ATP-binding protein [Candidatus Saccharibacteria bacterium]